MCVLCVCVLCLCVYWLINMWGGGIDCGVCVLECINWLRDMCVCVCCVCVYLCMGKGDLVA